MLVIYMTGNELRKKYLQFFAAKEHLILPSASLIPENDPSLLLIGAGMAPFKPFFTGKMKPPHVRVATSQKCVRTGDIENVGRTARHHTFFEMLGNFSFGDYFKKEATAWAWEFLTQHLEIPAENLWITIHTKDDEVFDIWRNHVGIPAEKIIRLEDNFWEIGPGPCGPCSEIYVDLGEDRGCGKPDCGVGCNCDRYLEIWNLVFTQYDRDEAGNYTPLVKKNIDTGAGLERIASVLQNKRSNFETDLLYPIIEHASAVAKILFGSAPQSDVSLKVIADHARSMTVMIADGILPSNEGRGYVLRRVLRRAARHGRLMGIDKPFLADIVDVVAKIFAEPYPDITEKKDYIKKVISMEEERFHATLAQGIELLNGHIENMKQSGKSVLDGTTGFKLYDTYGFPWELTQEILAEHDMTLDKKAFDQAMDAQRQRARTARQEKGEKIVIPDLRTIVTEKLTQDFAAEAAKVVVLLSEGSVIQKAEVEDDIALILDVTPFYAEGGGQVGDVGQIIAPYGKMEVTGAKKLPDGTIYHIGQVTEGTIVSGDSVKIVVDRERRDHTARNHTATHLLQAALRQVLGSHVNQAGSYVGPDRLRFDFSHFAPVSAEELDLIEQRVNAAILSNATVGIIETTQDIAREMGATALFGEKYGDTVRVVIVGDISKELCGGTHVDSTGNIGFFRIVSETSVGAGLRRIEAVTGLKALEFVKGREALLTEAASVLKTRPEDILSKVESLHNEIKGLERELAALHGSQSKMAAESLLAAKQTVKGLEVVIGQVQAKDMEDLRSTADMLRDRIPSGVVVLGAQQESKVNFVVMATPTAIAKGIHAGNIVKEVAKAAGGGGGGRPDMAQAGGKNPEKMNEALAVALDTITAQIK
ncbi:alanine--tRNA ligase [Acetonema longum]|uniref:Alanine--tRNA ligase n=1 Tax=Acetonema longum DSM 6540 TaxID=1009370 RepID=F7NLK8_9FIRM|nr:alanyl-tRNA synthetase [Acetonema longum DSM 6540]